MNDGLTPLFHMAVAKRMVCNSMATTYGYDPNGNRTSETKFDILSTSNKTVITSFYKYDGNNRLYETDYPDGTFTQSTYDALGHVVGTMDQKGRNTTTFYDAAGRAATIQYPDTRKSVYVYDNNGNRVTDSEYGTDGTVHVTYTGYDTLNHPATVAYLDGSKTISAYDGQGRVTDSFDENGNQTHYDYDQAGRRIDQYAGFNGGQPQETNYGYDNNGNQTSVMVGGVLQSTTGYDALNRAATVSYPQPSGQSILPVVTTFDPDGRKISQNDMAGKVTNYGYNPLNRLSGVTQVTSVGNLATSYGYDLVGNELTQTDANTPAHTTSYTYDVMNRRTKRTLPDGRYESYTNYDATGNLTSKTDFAGNPFTYGYNANGGADDLLTSVSGPVNLGFSYDGFLRRQSMTDPTGTTTFNYDSRDRMVAQNGPASFGTLAYTYWPGGQVNTVSSTNQYGNNLTYQIDGLNRPATILDGTKTTIISYDPIGNLAVITLPNGVAVTQGYDVLNRLTGVSITGGSGTLGSYQYTLGAAGNRMAVTELSGRAVSWTPDDLYRLISEDVLVDPSGNTGEVDYSYDPVGNRNTRNSTLAPVSPQNFTNDYNPADLLTPTFSYDAKTSSMTAREGLTLTTL